MSTLPGWGVPTVKSTTRNVTGAVWLIAAGSVPTPLISKLKSCTELFSTVSANGLGSPGVTLIDEHLDGRGLPLQGQIHRTAVAVERCHEAVEIPSLPWK